MDERVKMPRLLKYFLFFYVGTIGVMNVTGQDMGQNILGKIFYSTSLSIFTSLACYGLISILEDFRSGGLREIIRKLRRFFNV